MNPIPHSLIVQHLHFGAPRLLFSFRLVLLVQLEKHTTINLPSRDFLPIILAKVQRTKGHVSRARQGDAKQSAARRGVQIFTWNLARIRKKKIN